MNKLWGIQGQLRSWKRSMRLIGLKGLMGFIGLLGLLGMGFGSCSPEPPLHLYDAQEAMVELSVVDLDFESYWGTVMDLNTNMDIESNWYYGWDAVDVATYGEIGYTLPSVFEVRRYYTGEVPYAQHTGVIRDTIHGNSFQGMYDWGYWDMMLWNEIETKDGVQSIIIDENVTLDSVFAYTNQTMRSTRYNAPRFTHAFNAPEPLLVVYEQGIEINKNLDGFVFDEERNVWVRTLKLTLRPVTYIYLTQVILHNNKGRITSIDGNADLSGMARSTNMNTGRAGDDAITVFFNANLKKDREKDGELVDVIGGRVLTFGICGLQANKVTSPSEVRDAHRHYLDFTMQFNNGMDSTFVFDVTDQIREKYKGGIITVELDVDTIPIPTRSGGSGFDAVVKETEDGGTYEFDM